MSERDEFEAWHKREVMPDECLFERRADGRYNFAGTQNRWDAWQAARATPQQAVPEGWKLVPEQPTDRMVGVAIRKRDDYSDIHAGRKSYPYAETCELYRAMLAAAPQPEPQ